MTNAIADLRRARPILVHRDGHPPALLFLELARRRDVLLVDPATFLDDVRRPGIMLRCLAPGLYRAIPRLPVACRGRESTIHIVVRALLLDLIASNVAFADGFDAPIQWFCTPMPAPAMIGAFRESAVVYHRRPDLPRDRVGSAYDRFLLDHADIVLAAQP